MTPAASATPSLVPLAPAHSPEPPRGCAGRYAIIDWAEPPIVESVAAHASAMVVGTVTDVGPGQWNNKRNRRPRGGADPYLDVLRLLRVRVDTLIVGATQPELLAVWIAGGKIGCASFSTSEYPSDIQRGQRFVFGLENIAPRTGVAGVPKASAMWRIDSHGQVISPNEGPLSLDDLIERAR